METCKSLLFLFLYSLQGTVCSDSDNYKRLLLTDPDVLSSRLGHLESSIRDILAKYTAQEAVIQNLKTKVSHQEATIASLTTANSYAAGEKYQHSSSYHGGAANFLCLPNSPELTNKTAGGSSILYSVEYHDNAIRNGIYPEDMPCAVCRSKNSTSTVMIPARKTCFGDWKKEYDGTIVSGAYSHAASEFICLDSNPENVPGAHAITNGRDIYSTVMSCESLVCPPYKDKLQVLCVVCSK